MQRRVLIAALVAACVAVTTTFAADHFAGTWKNSDGRTTVVIEAVPNGLKATVKGVDEAGKPSQDSWTATFDGKDHPRPQGANGGSFVALKKIDDHTYEMVVKDKDHKVTMTRRVVHTPDGKTRTATTTRAADGRVTTMAYSRQ
jgi:uncharacterized protein (DUF2147 family)